MVKIVNTLKSHPLSFLTVAALLLATVFEHYWIWGLLFLWWAYTSWQTGEAFVLETIRIQDNAPLFYMITLMWAGFGLVYALQDLAWRLFGLYLPM